MHFWSKLLEINCFGVCVEPLNWCDYDTPCTQKSKYWIGYLFLLDVMYKNNLIEPSHKSYLQLKVL